LKVHKSEQYVCALKVINIFTELLVFIFLNANFCIARLKVRLKYHKSFQKPSSGAIFLNE
jgi:hypothetical protein